MTGALDVLVADDAEDIRALVRLSLERSGRFHVVAEAADGERAVALARAHQPDVCLLDMAMPVLDGLAALPRIREVAPGCAVVVLSALDPEAMREDALGRGAVGYLAKGLRPDDLVRELLSLLQPAASGGTDDVPVAGVDLAEDLQSARHARAFVRQTLETWDLADLVDPALLLASEVVTNAVLHARSASRLTMSLLGDRVRIEVDDWGGGHLEVRAPEAHEVNGRGLALVETLSDQWGTARTEAGKVVWFELGKPAAG